MIKEYPNFDFCKNHNFLALKQHIDSRSQVSFVDKNNFKRSIQILDNNASSVQVGDIEQVLGVFFLRVQDNFMRFMFFFLFFHYSLNFCTKFKESAKISKFKIFKVMKSTVQNQVVPFGFKQYFLITSFEDSILIIYI